MRQAVRKIASGLALVVACASGASYAAEANFPGSKPLPSPNRLATVYSVPPSDGAGNHRLLLSQKIDKAAPRELLQFGRHVKVSWAPDSRHVAVTDYAESDEATCLVIDPQTGSRIDLAEKAKISGEFASSERDQHRYVQCGTWKSADALTVTVRAWGDANPKGVVQHATFSLSHGFVTSKTKR